MNLWAHPPGNIELRFAYALLRLRETPNATFDFLRYEWQGAW